MADDFSARLRRLGHRVESLTRRAARPATRYVCGVGVGSWGVSVWATRRAWPWWGVKGRTGTAGLLGFAACVTLPATLASTGAAR